MGSLCSPCGSAVDLRIWRFQEELIEISFYILAYKMLPMLIIGILALVAGLSALFLPETLGHYMPESLEDAELYGKVEWATVKGHFGRI